MVSSNKKKIVKGISSQSIVVLTIGIVEIISFSIMSRLLSPQDFGYYALITAITTVFASFKETGIGAAIVHHKNITDQFLNNAFTLNLAFGCFISLLLIVLATPLSRFVADESLAIPLMLMSITLFSSCLTSINNSVMLRRLQFFRIGLIELIALIITTIVAVFLAINGYGYYSILCKSILQSLIILTLSFLGAHHLYKLSFNLIIIKSIINYSGWLMASVFFRNLSHQMDKMLMGRLLSIETLGSYNRPKEFITQITQKISGVFDTALFPVLSSIQDNKESLYNSLNKSLFLVNLFSSVLCMGFIFNSELLISIFLGEQWISINFIFTLLSISALFYVDGRLADCFLRSMGKTKAQFFFRIFETVVQILGVLVSYRFGVIGIVLSVLIVTAFSICVKLVYIINRLNGNWQTLLVIIKAWRILSIYLPTYFILQYFMTPSYEWYLLKLAIFIILTLLIFVFIPSIVGDTYKRNYFPEIVKLANKLNPFK